MKRWIAMLISMMLLLGLTACGSAPQSTEPEAAVPGETYDLVYDMTNYGFFQRSSKKNPWMNGPLWGATPCF